MRASIGRAFPIRRSKTFTHAGRRLAGSCRSSSTARFSSRARWRPSMPDRGVGRERARTAADLRAKPQGPVVGGASQGCFRARGARRHPELHGIRDIDARRNPHAIGSGSKPMSYPAGRVREPQPRSLARQQARIAGPRRRHVGRASEGRWPHPVARRSRSRRRRNSIR